MGTNIGILHLSDIHASKRNESTIKNLVSLLIDDLQKIKTEYDLDIDAIAITGDIIASGDESDEQLDIFYNNLIEPIMHSQELSEDLFFLVPGNHEVKQSKIDPYAERGLETSLTTEKSIDEFFQNDTSSAINRIKYFQEDFADLFGGKNTAKDDFFHSHIVNIKDVTIGLACINSAWRSCGKGAEEMHKMIIGKSVLNESFRSIKTSDIKIGMFHHPTDCLIEEDKISVEKCLDQFDIILNGHIHQSLTHSNVTFNGTTLINTCGKFDNSSDIYNGYSIICINPYNKDCNVIVRKYIDYPRNCYDAAIEVCENGLYKLSLSQKDDILALTYNVTRSISNNFISFANGFFVSNVASEKSVGGFEELFIRPILSEFSEYEKESPSTMDDDNNQEAYTIDYLSSDNSNFLILGRKELGKTTLIRYLTKYYISNFNTHKLVPIIINTKLLDYSGKNAIERACKKFIDEYCDKSDSFSKEQLNLLLSNGKCVILFDDFDLLEQNKMNIVNDFIEKFPDNKYIFTETEVVNSRAFKETPIQPVCDYKKLYISPLTKGQIRTIANACLANIGDASSTSLVDKIMLCFKKTTLPKTPFVLSLLLSLCGNSDFAPINEVSVLERFMEKILEKSSPNEFFSETFDFKNKEDFLIYLVTEMNSKNQYYFSIEEFNNIIDTYHKHAGFAINETKFDKIFFEKGVLIIVGDIITFRYSCMVEYYLAKKASSDPEFLKKILQNKNYLNYNKEIFYYAGMNRKDKELINFLQNELYNYFNVFKVKLSELDDYNIGFDFSLPQDTFVQKINEGRFTQDESDRISDSADYSESILPERIDKTGIYSDEDSFINTLLLYGGCLKNLELLDYKMKLQGFKDFLLGLRIMVSILKETTELFLKNELFKDEDSMKENDKKRIKDFINDSVKIILPLTMQNIALETVGTTKLKQVYRAICSDSTNDDFDVFFCTFTMCDLRLPNVKDLIHNYVKKTKDSSLLKIILVKLLYYYQFRYYGNNLDKFLEEELADINIRIQHKSKSLKTKYVEEIKQLKARQPLEH